MAVISHNFIHTQEVIIKNAKSRIEKLSRKPFLKRLDRKPFLKRLDRKPFLKRLDRKPRATA
jgi:hypothetical protein